MELFHSLEHKQFVDLRNFVENARKMANREVKDSAKSYGLKDFQSAEELDFDKRIKCKKMH